jgi:hypothetical protein
MRDDDEGNEDDKYQELEDRDLRSVCSSHARNWAGSSERAGSSLLRPTPLSLRIQFSRQSGRKDVLQMRRLALKAASRGAGGNGNGDIVGGEVRKEL